MLMETTSKNLTAPTTPSSNKTMDITAVTASNNTLQAQSPSSTISSMISATPSPSSSSLSSLAPISTSSLLNDNISTTSTFSVNRNQNNSGSSTFLNMNKTSTNTNNYSQDLFDHNNFKNTIGSIGASGSVFVGAIDPVFYFNNENNQQNNYLYLQQQQNKIQQQSQNNAFFPNQMFNKMIQQQQNRINHANKNLKPTVNNPSCVLVNKNTVQQNNSKNNSNNNNKLVSYSSSSSSSSSNQAVAMKNFNSSPSISKNLWNNNGRNNNNNSNTDKLSLNQQQVIMNNGLFSTSTSNNNNYWLPSVGHINNHNQNLFVDSSTNQLLSPLYNSGQQQQQQQQQQQSNRQFANSKFSPFIGSNNRDSQQPNQHQNLIDPIYNRDVYTGLLPNDQEGHHHQSQTNVSTPSWTIWDQPNTTNSTNTSNGCLRSNQNQDVATSSSSNGPSTRNLFNVWSESGNGADLIDPLPIIGAKTNHRETDPLRPTSLNNHLGLDASNSLWENTTSTLAVDEAPSSSMLSNVDGLQTSQETASLIGNRVNLSANTSNNLDRSKHLKLLAEFYHENLKYFMKEDIQMTKMTLSFYGENFSKASTKESPSMNLNDLETEQIILNRLLSTNNSYISNDLKQFEEFANIYYDLQEHERRSQYLDKVLIQSKFEDLRKLYTSLFSSDNNGSLEHSVSSSSTSSLDQNNNSNHQNLNYEQKCSMFLDKLKQLQRDSKHLQDSNDAQAFHMLTLRLLKYYKKLLNMVPKEILLNILLINELDKNSDKVFDDIDIDSDDGHFDDDSFSKKRLAKSFKNFMSILQNTTLTGKNRDIFKKSDSHTLENEDHNNFEVLEKDVDKKATIETEDEILKETKPKVHENLVGIKMDQTIYYPNYFPISSFNMNFNGPVMIFFNRPSKSPKQLIGNITHNWNLIESIEYETQKCINRALVLDRFDNFDISGNSDIAVAADEHSNTTKISTSMKRLIRRLKELFPNIPTNQIGEIICQAKYAMMKRYKTQYGFSGLKMSQIVNFISEMIVENGICETAKISNSSNNGNKNVAPSTPVSTASVTKGMSWSKIAAQSNNNNTTINNSINQSVNCITTSSTVTGQTSVSSTNTIKETMASNTGITNMTSISNMNSNSMSSVVGAISPIMKPTPSSTPLSSTSSSSLSSSLSNSQRTIGSGNFNSYSMLTHNNETNNSTNSNICALCKNLIQVDKNNQTPVRFINNKGAGYRIPQCKHVFHRECIENMVRNSSPPINVIGSPTKNATSWSNLLNNNTCPICEKLFILRKDEFPSLN